MKKEIKTRQQLIERLNEIDKKCIDEGTHFYDFKTLFEATSDRLSAQDKVALKKAVDIGDKETIEAVFQAKMAEDLEEDFEEDDRIKIDEVRDAFLTLGNDPYSPNPFDWLKEFPKDKLNQKVVKILLDKGYRDEYDYVQFHWPEIVVDDLTEKEMLKIYAGGRGIRKKGDYYIFIEGLQEDFDNDVIEYKGYCIEHGFYGGDEYTVQYDGDDVEFNSVEDAKQFIDEVSEYDLYEDIDSDKDIRNYAKELVKSISSKLKSHVTRSYNNCVKEYGKKGAIDTLKYIYFYVYLTGDEEAFDNDDYLYSLVYDLTQNSPNNTKDLSDYLWYYIREFIREYFSKKYLNKEYTIKDLKEDINRYSDVIPKEERKFWYFTTHGVQPGSIPADLNVLEIKDTPNGTFVALDGVLNTSELIKYDMKEKAPMDESLDSDDNITGNTWQEFISNIEAQTKYDVDSSYKRRPEKWIELINKETGDIFDAEVTKYFDGSYELMLYNVTPKYESLDESLDYEDFLNWCEKQYYPGFNPMDLSDEEYYALEDAYRKDNSLKEGILTNDEYDYFNVYDEYGLVGEFPTYEDAKNACGEGCTINGVVQYGGNEYEETPLNEDIALETNPEGIPFEYYIYFDDSDVFEELSTDEKYEVFKDADDDLYTFLNSDLVKNTVKEELDITIEDIEFVDYVISSEEIHGTLYIHTLDDINVSIKNLFDVLNRLLYKWEYRTEITIQGSKRDVDDWDEWEADLYATAELDYSE